MRSIFLEGDTVCNLDGVRSNRAWIDTIPSHSMSVMINYTDMYHF